MAFNREKIVFGLALLIFIGGLYYVTIGIITPGPAIHVPDVDLPRSHRELGKPEYRRFTSDEVPRRNPFSFSEGWTRLDTLPLAAPPLPAPGRIFPVLGDPAGSEAPGFIYVEKPPREVDERSGRSASGGTE